MANSRAQMPEGGCIKIYEGKQTTSHIEVLIKDNGPGIAAEMLNRVFLPFVTSNAEKRGLGLSLARKKMIHMGGMISAEPCDSGTKISLLIPLAKDKL
ncbi:MAG: ATP-binding protein [Acidobacteria bacterium]|nr:ATP-binding protein [Acidobacteriota bacterium]